MDGNWFDGPDAEIERPGAKPPKVPRRKRAPRTNKNLAKRTGKPVADDKVCGARRHDGGTCTRGAGHATDHPGYGPCSQHMGNTSAGRKSGAQDMAAELVRFYAEPVDTDPITALLDEVGRTAGYVQWLGNHLARFDIPVHELDDEGNKVPAGLSPSVAGWVAVWQSERQQLVRVSKAALDAGVNERLVAIAEHQGTRLAATVERILHQLNLTAEQQALVPQVVPRELRGLFVQPQVIEGTTNDGL